METHSRLRAFQIYIYANLDPRDEWKCAQYLNGVALLRSAFNGCITFPRLIAYPRVFLTLCAGGKYTSKFRMLPELWQPGLTEKTPKPTRHVV